MISSKVKGPPSSLTMSARAFCGILLAVSENGDEKYRYGKKRYCVDVQTSVEPGIADHAGTVGLIFRSLSVMTRLGSACPARSTSFEGFILTPLSSGWSFVTADTSQLVTW
jgi:hypothetical protein